jgi:hypothetical protein
MDFALNQWWTMGVLSKTRILAKGALNYGGQESGATHSLPARNEWGEMQGRGESEMKYLLFRSWLDYRPSSPLR